MASNAKEQAEKAIAVIDGLLANVPPGARNQPKYREMLAERNRLAQLIGLPGVDSILSIGDSFIDFVDDVGEIGDLSLNFVRGFGSALIDGIDGAFDAVQMKLAGREPAVIAGLTSAIIVILVAAMLWNTAKNTSLN